MNIHLRTNLEKASLKIYFFPSEFSIKQFAPRLGVNVLQGTGQNVPQTALNDLSCNRFPRVSFSPGLS